MIVLVVIKNIKEKKCVKNVKNHLLNNFITKYTYKIIFFY